MTKIDLGAQLAGRIFPFMLVFVRIGAGFMLFPGIGEAFVMARVRLIFALLVTFLIFPALTPQLPPEPSNLYELVRLIAIECLVGLFFGSVLRILMGAAETAGAVIAVQTGLSNAMILNPTLASQSALSSALLSTTAIALVFLTGLDHFLITALVKTYTLFPAGQPVQTGDMAQAFIKLFSSSFTVGVEMAAPFLIVGLMLNIALGMIQRMMPQVQLFLVVVPLQVWGGLFLFAVTITAIMSVWLQFFDASMKGLG